MSLLWVLGKTEMSAFFMYLLHSFNGIETELTSLASFALRISWRVNFKGLRRECGKAENLSFITMIVRKLFYGMHMQT